MADKQRVNLVVHNETKQKWDNAVEESTEYSSLSDLIRQAVAHELADGNQTANDTNTEAPESEAIQGNLDALQDVTDALARIESSLNGLDQRVGNLESEISASQADTGLQNQLFEVLPTPPEEDSQGNVEGNPGQWGKTVSDLAEETGANPENVQDTLDDIQSMTKTVQSVSGGPNNQTVYYRRE